MVKILSEGWAKSSDLKDLNGRMISSEMAKKLGLGAKTPVSAEQARPPNEPMRPPDAPKPTEPEDGSGSPPSPPSS